MEDFIHTVQDISRKRIDELKVSHDQLLSALKDKHSSEIEQLETRYNRLKKRVSRQKEQEESWRKEQQNMFHLEKEKEAIIQKKFDSVLDDFLSDEANVQAWLEAQLDLLEKEEGTVYAGSSYAQLEKIVKKQSNWKLEKSDELKKDQGFIFESKKLYFDARISSTRKSLYQQIRTQVYQLVQSGD
ncbi:MAG: hypothetical protein ACOCXQ_00390 [Patescibacteria group bacterium]